MSSLYKDSSILGEQRSKTGEGVVDQIGHMLERFDQRLTLSNLRLAERYIKAGFCQLEWRSSIILA